MTNGIFRKTSLEKITSPEQLDKYIKVTSPSVWMILCAVLALLAAAFVWSVNFTIETTLPAKGFAQGDFFYCLVSPEDADKLSAGMEVKSEGTAAGHVLTPDSRPVSAEDVRAALQNDYLADSLELPKWSEIIVIAPAAGVTLPQGEPVRFSIVTEKTRPIDFLFNQRVTG